MNWLPHLVSLSQVKDFSGLTMCFCQAICQTLMVPDAWVLTQIKETKILQSMRDTGGIRWPLGGQDDPFTNVLQKEIPLCINKYNLLKLIEKKEIEQGSKMLVPVLKDDFMLLFPLSKMKGNGSQLLAINGSESLFETLLTCSNWRYFCDIFANQQRLLSSIPQQDSSVYALSSKVTVKPLKTIEKKAKEKALSLNFIGGTQVMTKMREKIITAAQSQLTVLIHGETGVGKELVARALHDFSSRSHRALVTINCAAIPDTLLESELFGYAKGAFSGAERDKKGLIEEANGGTLFLDEIGDMPFSLQAKLLRALETKTFRPLGGRSDISVDFRLVVATHVDLLDQVNKGTFRQDLYYRLNQFPLSIPPLRARKEDLFQLVSHFIAAYNERHQTQVIGIQTVAMDLLKQYEFPGNVRELRNLIDYACALTCEGHEISSACFDDRIAISALSPLMVTGGFESLPDHIGFDLGKIRNLKKAVMRFESKIISARLETYGGNRAMAAESLGLPKRTLAHKCLRLERDS